MDFLDLFAWFFFIFLSIRFQCLRLPVNSFFALVKYMQFPRASPLSSLTLTFFSSLLSRIRSFLHMFLSFLLRFFNIKRFACAACVHGKVESETVYEKGNYSDEKKIYL